MIALGSRRRIADGLSAEFSFNIVFQRPVFPIRGLHLKIAVGFSFHLHFLEFLFPQFSVIKNRLFFHFFGAGNMKFQGIGFLFF